MSKVFVTAEEAEKLLRVAGEFTPSSASSDGRAVMLNVMRCSTKNVEVSQDAACFDHYLAVKIDGMVTYIETNLKALGKFGLLPPHRKVA
ncbi:hypothetical protein [Cupriavidus pauculus]|uniref:hypothetical protein n=1 Tax=Cupriavidus pauculus TaxID=82633 RepID=UPI000B03394C|nr:hypothetical protein [Cupriavidus pauculus]